MERISSHIQLNIELLCCPICRGKLAVKPGALTCSSAHHGPFAVDRNGRPFLLTEVVASQYQVEHQAGINKLKSFLKQYPSLYYFIWNIFCPVWVSRRGLKKFRSFLPPSAKVVNLGSGPRRIDESWINMDVVPFENVDLVADALNLPFQDDSLDAVINESLLEHVPNPTAAIKEISRVLKPGGLVYTSTPFLTPYHASPDDFNRWTQSGMRVLFSNFEKLAGGADSGPWSALLVFLAYSLGVIFSFGNKKFGTTLAFLFMILLGPLKIFDFIFVRIPGAEAVAAQLYFIGRKQK